MTLDAGLSSATQRFGHFGNFRWWDVRFNYTVRKFGRRAVEEGVSNHLPIAPSEVSHAQSAVSPSKKASWRLKLNLRKSKRL